MYAASIGLGVKVRLLAEGPETSAASVVQDVTVGDYTDPRTVRVFAEKCDVVTFDHEHVPTGLLRDLESAGAVLRPGPAALIHAQDKVVMRDRLNAMGAPCPVNRVVLDGPALVAFGTDRGWPVIATCFAIAGSTVSSVALTHPSASGALTRYQALSSERSSNVTISPACS